MLNKLLMKSLTNDVEYSLPPFVINEYDPIISFAAGMYDWGPLALQVDSIKNDFNLTGNGVRVAVIDTGVNPNHVDIKHAVEKTLNTTNEAYGWSNGHGTGCAACIAGTADHGGFWGVAPNAKIVAIKALKESGSGSNQSIIKAIDLAIKEKVDIINMSLGSGMGTSNLHRAIKKAVSKGILVVAAAGNTGRPNDVNYPAHYQEAFAIGASNTFNRVSVFSSRGWELECVAPGEEITTAWSGRDNARATVSGTSFATPYTAGCFALFLEAGIKVTHDLITSTAEDIEKKGRDAKSGYGLVDPYRIIDEHYSKNKTLAVEDPKVKAKEVLNRGLDAIKHFMDENDIDRKEQQWI